MLLGGDEFGRTQHGNNNGYCQDNELSWFDWEHMDDGLRAFVARVIQLPQGRIPCFSAAAGSTAGRCAAPA